MLFFNIDVILWNYMQNMDMLKANLLKCIIIVVLLGIDDGSSV
jgi:hypothetical protein